ncbi:MAG TPA: Rne/Rng family ribonuclease, partial [Terriglobales bacterium]|nr:Rne/Rng family ribonuclease [Terriglobales bacterium]
SISKYRRIQEQQQSEPQAVNTENSVGMEAVGDDAHAEAPNSFVPPADTVEHEAHDQATEVPEAHAHEVEAPHHHEDKTEERYDGMNVAAAFGGEEVETEANAVEADEHDQETYEASGIVSEADGDAQVPEINESLEEPREHEDAHEFHAESDRYASEHHDQDRDQPAAEVASYQTAPEGAYSEEEIEAEEEELPHPTENLYDEEDYEELEEEILERTPYAAAEGNPQAEVANASAVFEGGYEGDEEDDEIEEAEKAAYAEIGEPEEARAELRGPSGTAGYQQRARRPEFDRRRGRRGGGGGGRRFGRGGPRRESMQRQHVVISDLLKEGQEVLVQIAKEPIGKKGARITSHIALPGRFLVYMPTVNHIGVSRKINSDEERMRLKRIVASERENGHGGFIVRTAAAHISEEDLRADIRFLKNLWHDIRTRAENSKPPALIYHDLNLVERIMRDLVTQDFAAIWVDTEQEYERVSRFISRFQPGLVRRVKLYTKTTPLFEQFGIDAEINKALKSKVWLKSGGYIVINQTEALVAIDINTGKYVGKTSRLEDTIVKTNIDAIKEIVRQIRLRDLGGIIVIDFIDMDERRNRQKVMQALEEEMRNDRAPSKVLQFNDFGLVAITRKRVKQSLERTLGTPCPYCTGNGYVKSPSTICNEIYVEMRKMAKQFESDILLRVNPEVAKALKADNSRWLQEMEELTGQNILVKSDPTLHQEQFDM